MELSNLNMLLAGLKAIDVTTYLIAEDPYFAALGVSYWIER